MHVLRLQYMKLKIIIKCDARSNYTACAQSKWVICGALWLNLETDC